ncbi:TRAP transporter small permease [Lacrimispora sp.]|uniref:TRAP transporter small permease n=1 Tax=Lacrimispora sp. TaxID=2719234 RepID=UPI0029E32EA6|nr:TRAP-type transport system small permease protein [Lacrimispora sp.]
MLEHVEEIFESIGLSLLIVLVFSAAVLRFFGVDMSWSTDLAQLTFAWVCFIGADLAIRKNRHMGVDMLVNRFPLKVRNGIYLFNSILMLCFLAFVVYYGTNLCVTNFQRKFNTLPISYSFATASGPVGGLLMIFTVVANIRKYIGNFIKRDYTNLVKAETEGGDIL